MKTFKLLWSILERDAKRQVIALLFLTTISGFVEIVSVGLIIPFIALASGSLPFGRANVLTRSLLSLVQAFGVPRRYTTLSLGVVFLLGIVLANLFLCLYQYYAARVISLQRSNFSVRIMRSLARRPMEWLERQNSSDLLKVTMSDVSYVSSVTNALVQIAAIYTRCAVVYLFFLATQFTLAITLVGSLIFLYLIVFRFIRRPIQKAGEASQDAQADMFRAASELLGGARAVRATNTEEKFFRRFSEASDAAVVPQVIRSMPPYVTRAGLETATVAVVIGLLIYFNAKDGSLANGLPLLSSYAVDGIRLLPAVQQSLAYLLEVRFYYPCLEEVVRLLHADEVEQSWEPQPDIPFAGCLELRQASYSYSNGSPVLKDISLKINKTTRVAFVGETGAGKSTVIDLIMALRFPQEGGLWVDDKLIDRAWARSWRRSVGFVPQSIYLLDATLAENIAFGESGSEICPERLRSACEAASLTDFINTLPEGLQTFVGERGVRLSGGQCQRIGIARALYRDPEVVIFDEATSSLDSVTENSVLEAIEKLSGAKTLIVIAHRLNTVWDFDELFVLDQGCLVAQGTSRALLESCPRFADLARHQVASNSV